MTKVLIVPGFSSDAGEVRRCLQGAALNLSSPFRWVQGRMSTNRNNMQCFCLAGAVRAAMGEAMTIPIPSMLRPTLYKDCLLLLCHSTVTQGPENLALSTAMLLEAIVTDFNDSHGHCEVSCALSNAIALAKGLQ